MRAVFSGLAAGLVSVAMITAPFAQTPAEPDVARATELYNAATQAMTEARYDDAARDFAAAFELTRDPVLHFKLGSAYEKAGKCDLALTHYGRYLAEAAPEPALVALTQER